MSDSEQPTEKSRSEVVLDRALQATLVLLALSAPISIAATQTAWAIGLLIWIIRAVVVRPPFRVSRFDMLILAFVGLSLLSSMFSYEPGVSLRKMIGVSLVTIVYLAWSAARSSPKVRQAAVAILVVSACVSVLYTLGTLAVGRGLKINEMTVESPLRAAGVRENDTILTTNGHRIDLPTELVSHLRQIGAEGVAVLKIYRYESLIDLKLPNSEVLMENDEALGILQWQRGRDRRAAGFFGHYTTFAEALQLVLSLALGLMVALPGALFQRYRLLLAGAVGLLAIGLALSLTRASWAAFAISAGVIVLIGASRRALLVCVVLAIPLAVGAAVYLQQKRNVGFVDASDASTTWRTTVWREGSELLASSPRHLAVGIGMDSIKTRYIEWGLFDNGRLPIGHMHSTPLQIALERGLPTFIAWIAWMAIYLRMLRRGLRDPARRWCDRGLLLGALGGSIGFLASGLVHYNWGDSEVVMIFYLLMGLSLAVLGRDGGELSPA